MQDEEKVILGAPFDAHSAAFKREVLRPHKKLVLFNDGGLARWSEGNWRVELDGPMREASRFVTSQLQL